MINYLVCTIKPWNIDAFYIQTRQMPGTWHLICNSDEFIIDKIKKINPRYIFFPHWSWKINSDIIENYECIGFHMTELPYGRGGSPLQNLILKGCDRTIISALRLTNELDAGPIYNVKKLVWLDGSAQQIYNTIAMLCYDIIKIIISENLKPLPQKGEAIYFKRRTPEQSILPLNGSLKGIYDFIRMLDAETYPKAFIEWGDLILHFDHAEIPYENKIKANVTIKIK